MNEATKHIPGSQAWCGGESEHGCEACRGYQNQCGIFVPNAASVAEPPDFEQEEVTKKVAPLFLDPAEFDDDYITLGGEDG